MYCTTVVGQVRPSGSMSCAEASRGCRCIARAAALCHDAGDIRVRRHVLHCKRVNQFPTDLVAGRQMPILRPPGSQSLTASAVAQLLAAGDVGAWRICSPRRTAPRCHRVRLLTVHVQSKAQTLVTYQCHQCLGRCRARVAQQTCPHLAHLRLLATFTVSAHCKRAYQRASRRAWFG